MNIDFQPVLTNDLVSLRPLTPSDFELLYAVASDFLIWEQHQNKNRYTQENFTTFFNESIASKKAMVILDAKTEKIIGSSRFKSVDELNGVVEIGWSFLGRTYWGGQYNRAFKKLMVNYALEHFKHVVFYVHPKNHRSQKAMEKLGAFKLNHGQYPWVLKEERGVTYTLQSPLED